VKLAMALASGTTGDGWWCDGRVKWLGRRADKIGISGSSRREMKSD